MKGDILVILVLFGCVIGGCTAPHGVLARTVESAATARSRSACGRVEQLPVHRASGAVSLTVTSWHDDGHVLFPKSAVSCAPGGGSHASGALTADVTHTTDHA